MIFSRRPACVASGAISTQSPCVEIWTNAGEVINILLGKVCAHVLCDFYEALAGFGIISAPLVRGSVFASLDALPRCADAFPSPNIGVVRYDGFMSLIYWDKWQVAYYGVGAILSGFSVAVFASSGVSMRCNIVPRGW